MANSAELTGKGLKGLNSEHEDHKSGSNAVERGPTYKFKQ
jgi:hypothetical protein